MLDHLAIVCALCRVSSCLTCRYYIHIVEKVKYIYKYIREELGSPNFTAEEQIEYDEIEGYLRPMLECNATGYCR